MFEITYENEKGEKAMVWQNSWAYSTRTVNLKSIFLLLLLIAFSLLVYWSLFVQPFGLYLLAKTFQWPLCKKMLFLFEGGLKTMVTYYYFKMGVEGSL